MNKCMYCGEKTDNDIMCDVCWKGYHEDEAAKDYCPITGADMGCKAESVKTFILDSSWEKVASGEMTVEEWTAQAQRGEDIDIVEEKHDEDCKCEDCAHIWQF